MERYIQLQGIVPNKQYKKQLMDTSGRMSLYEDYVSFETAKLLKEKGFKEWCLKAYWPNGSICNQAFSNAKEIIAYSRPTIQMAMKWLREVHNQIIVPNVRVEDPISGIINCYIVGIWYIPKNNGGALCFISPTPENGYSSYEEACESAIKYCLENLI